MADETVTRPKTTAVEKGLRGIRRRLQQAVGSTGTTTRRPTSASTSAGGRRRGTTAGRQGRSRTAS